MKAARAIDTKSRGEVTSKALHFQSDAPFWMNFQQLKPDACDVFVFIGVWVDRIVFWVISREEASGNKYFSHQHRGGVEYQIGITDKNMPEFETYRTDAHVLADTIIAKG